MASLYLPFFGEVRYLVSIYIIDFNTDKEIDDIVKSS